MPRQVEQVPIHKLKPNPRNARTHSKKQVRQIANSIRRFGFTAPLLADENNIILGGHGRFTAAQDIGLLEVPVIRIFGLRDAEKRALALADNKIAANAGWDRKILAAELGELSSLLLEYDLTIDITGFDTPEIDALHSDILDSGPDPSDHVPPLCEHAASTLGDCWLLGEHRLLCADAQSGAAFKRLMGSDQATMSITDPPYNVKTRSVQGRGKTRHGNFKQAAGEMSPEEFSRFLQTAFAHIARHAIDGSIHYSFMDWRHTAEILSAIKNVFDELKNTIVWVKPTPRQGSFYRSQHEFVFVSKKGEAPHINNFELGQYGRTRSNVWTYPGVNTFRVGHLDDLSLHPTVKPVALVADAMKDCSRRGDIVLDPFIGSGTTILAAERVGRRAYGIEIDPRYVDAAIRRWQHFTKRDAVLRATGETFDEVTLARSAQRARRAK